MINQRKDYLSAENESSVNFSPTNVFGNVEKGLKSTNYAPIRECLSKCSRGFGAARSYWEDCCNIISRMDGWPRQNEILEAQNIFLEHILPKLKDLDRVKAYASNRIKSKSFLESVNEKCDILAECDRVAHNNKMLETRYNFGLIVRNNESYEDTIETLCELVDTYPIHVNAKLNIALESILCSFSNNAVDVDRPKAIQQITEYFLRYNDVIPDKYYSKICSVLENNKFLSGEDISKVYYLFSEQNSFGSKVAVGISAENDVKYKSLVDNINKCKTVSAAKILIKNAFQLIFDTFIIGGVVTFGTVTILLAAVFSLILEFIVSPILIIKEIDAANKKIDVSKLSNEEKARGNQVTKYVNDRLNDLNSNNAVKEVANIIDNTCRIKQESKVNPNVKNLLEYTGNNTGININSLLESKDFADSDDVKTIINKYKADQNKNEGKLKSALSHIYAKKPEKIIDDTPNILEFIRNFGILSTLAISPIVTLVVFCVDKFIELGIKRKEADRVLKYFKSEKTKIDKKLYKMSDGDKKDRMNDYAESLDKAITKLEDYRDNLYSEKELDRIRDLEEATSIHPLNKLPLDDYYNNFHVYVCNNISRALQLFKNEAIRRLVAADIEEYELNPDEKISKSFLNASPEFISQYFVTCDGMISLPLFKINYSADHISTTVFSNSHADVTTSKSLVTNDLYSDVTDICSFVNDYLPGDCTITNGMVGDYIFVVFNYLHCLSLNDDSADYALPPELKEEMATILSLDECVEDIEKLYPIDTMKDLFKNMETIAGDDVDLVSYMAATSKCVDMNDYKENLKDIQSATSNPTVSTNIMMSLNNNYTCDDASLLESSVIQLESLKILSQIIQEAQDGNKKPVQSVKDKINFAVNNGKKSVDSKVNKGKGAAVSLKTNAKFAAQMVKKKAMTFDTKQQEVSKNIDVSLSSFKKSIEKGLREDKREQIIKGTIIPSFSKIIKAGMAAGALYLINPVLAAIGVFGAMACSKALL
jgi:hypothetical protein